MLTVPRLNIFLMVGILGSAEAENENGLAPFFELNGVTVMSGLGDPGVATYVCCA